ncbi:hypothetical protein CBX96_08680 [Shewanella sp. BC20]|uniref:hypothetical protein n=1 Tax=Shewanella sp. BC20 TaxID=2004459 RepID=UPI000D6445C8|nr:hypothetical protein [Shewanella sp. BC20]PWF63899.1 hypothetical protein CBX96_08680 [Shewanella sp. BC20]
MKNLKKALVASAVLAGLAGNAYAGTEACFEVYKVADGAGVIAHDAIYANASCIAEADRTGAATGQLQATTEGKIAYELTKSLEVPFNAINAAQDLQIVYIPTTDIPPGTLIEMELTGAVFSNNANQIHLVKGEVDTGPAVDKWTAVGSSDGTVDGTNKVKFITKAGITIGAGTRLVLSQTATVAAAADVAPVQVKITNDGCTDSTSTKQVTIAATTAKTDGGTGYDIQGAVSKAQLVLDISPQFVTFFNHATSEAEVNAESADSANNAIVARTEFVYDQDASKQLVAKQTQVVYKGQFYNRGTALDKAITLGADDHLETKFVASADPRSNVQMALWNARVAATGVLATQEEVETGTQFGVFGLTAATATVYDTEAVDVFAPEATGGDAETNPYTGTLDATKKYLDGAAYNELFYVVTNTDPAEIMNFNYKVNTDYTLSFNDANYLDHCAASKNTHDIGVNGAVLKVPYATNAAGNFVRVTNEHTEEAEVTVDIFGESVNGTAEKREAIAVTLGKVPAKSSVVYFVPDLINKAVADQGYKGQDGGYAQGQLGSNAVSAASRHTLTFTVTAPRETVHGVSVQKVINGSDRVMPVLDLNTWQQ